MKSNNNSFSKMIACWGGGGGFAPQFGHKAIGGHEVGGREGFHQGRIPKKRVGWVGGKIFCLLRRLRDGNMKYIKPVFFVKFKIFV